MGTATMALPAYATLIPLYRIMSSFSLVITNTGIVLVYVSGLLSARLVKDTRDQTFKHTAKVKTRDQDGNEKEVEKVVNHTTAIFSLGGATIDNEWNYSHSKLMRGLGIVAIENQARI